MKVAVAVLLAVVGVLAWRLTAEVGKNRQQSAKIQELTARLADSSNRDNMELQARCASQAEKVFHALSYKENIDIYQSHYNPSLNKCFMTIERLDANTTPGTMSVNKFLLDAYEQREYGEYIWMSSQTKKYWEVPPKICKLIPSSGGEQLCHTEEEYKAFVARYME